MKQLQDLLETGVYQEYVPPKAMTVRDWLQELNLNQIFTVLVNGKKADLDLEIGPKDKVVIIPQIAGGFNEQLNFLKGWFETMDDIISSFSGNRGVWNLYEKHINLLKEFLEVE